MTFNHPSVVRFHPVLPMKNSIPCQALFCSDTWEAMAPIRVGGDVVQVPLCEGCYERIVGLPIETAPDIKKIPIGRVARDLLRKAWRVMTGGKDAVAPR